MNFEEKLKDLNSQYTKINQEISNHKNMINQLTQTKLRIEGQILFIKDILEEKDLEQDKE